MLDSSGISLGVDFWRIEKIMGRTSSFGLAVEKNLKHSSLL